jgi:hypothetical protein
MALLTPVGSYTIYAQKVKVEDSHCCRCSSSFSRSFSFRRKLGCSDVDDILEKIPLTVHDFHFRPHSFCNFTSDISRHFHESEEERFSHEFQREHIFSRKSRLSRFSQMHM